MVFELVKTKVSFTDKKTNKQKWFFRFYLVCGDVVIAIRPDDYKGNNFKNQTLLNALASEKE